MDSDSTPALLQTFFATGLIGGGAAWLAGESIAEVFRSVGGQIRQSWCGPCFGQGPDALGKGHPPDLVIIPGHTEQVAAIARLCNEHRVPLPRPGSGSAGSGRTCSRDGRRHPGDGVPSPPAVAQTAGLARAP